MTSSNLRNVATLLMTASFTVPVLAQETSQVDDDEEVVVIQGVRLIQREAIKQKNASGVIADFLGTDDLTQSVDLNIADSLRRLPGVNTIFDEDEGRYVAIRGLESNFTFFTFDGIQLASVDRNSRRVNTEMIPPTAVKRLEVLKTLTPELEGNAIGGHVNLVTQSAFDEDDGYSANFNVEVGHHTSSDVPNGEDGPSPKLSAGISKVFGQNDEFGVVLGGYYFDKIRDQERFENINLFEADDGHVAIDDPFAQDYTNKIERRSVLGKLEYKPSERLYTFVSANWFDYQYDEVRYRNTIDGNGEPTGTDFLEGRFQNGDAQHRVNTFPLNLTVTTFNGGLEFDIDEQQRVTFDAGYSEGTNDEPSLQVRWTTPNSDDAGFAYSLAAGEEGIPRITVNTPSFISDLSNYNLNRISLSEFNMVEEVTTLKGDYAFNMDTTDGFGFKAGARVRTLEKDFQNELNEYRPNVDISGADFTSTTFRIPYAGWLAPISDFNAANEFRIANPGLFDLRQPDGDNIGRDFSFQEDVSAIFFMGKYASGPVEIVGGVRYEETEIDARFFTRTNDGFEETTDSGTYENVLPSAILTYALDDDKRIRVAYSQAIGRPNFSDLAGSGTASRFDIDAETGLITTVNVNLNNPDLEPRESNNYDIAFDWFIADDQFFSIAAFSKDIDNYIFDTTREVDTLSDPELVGVDFEGLPLASDGVVTITKPENSQTASVTGLEVQYYDEKLSFLPGFLEDFGIITNATWLDGSVDLPNGNGESPLIEQPDLQANFSLIYTLENFETRVTYAYRDKFVNSLNIDDTSRSRFEDEYTDINLDVRYDFTDNLVMKFKVRNLLDEPRKDIYGDGEPERGAVREVNAFGQSYWLGLSFKF